MKYELEITRQCNFKCKGCDRLCNIIKDNNSDMTLDEVKKIVDEINARNEKLEHFVVIGGEPTMNPWCFEICHYIIKNLKNCKYFAVATNHSYRDIRDSLKDIGWHIRHDDHSEDLYQIMENKRNKHYDILVSPKEENYGITDPRKCWVLRNCSTSIHKYRGKIKYCWCGAGTSICKLLMKDQFMKDSLKELFESDLNEYLNEICPNCMYVSKKKVFVKDNEGERISKCFIEGLNKIKKEND